jgi:thiol-disulfide isomerase/thioredoxin
VSGTALTKDNFAQLANGRQVFIKAFAPWCGHCKAMKPAWDSLMTDFQDSATLWVTECDCTADCKSLCSDLGVNGYPSIKFGTVGSLEDYKGGRDYDSLKRQADSIKPGCSKNRRERCSAQELEQLDDLLSKSKEELTQLIAEQEAVISVAESAFKQSVQVLQDQYTQLVQNKDNKIREVQNSGLQMMRMVLGENE